MFSLYDQYCMIDIDAGPCSRGTAQIQAFPAKCLDESFAFQYVNLVPQGWASSMIYWTLRWAHHTSHHPELHTSDHTGAAMFMRSTPGCGTLAGPSLEWVAFRSPRPNGFAISPGLKRTCTYHIWLLSKPCISRDCVMSLASECICTYWFRLAVAISLLFLQ